SVPTRMSMASRLTMVRSPPWNFSFNGSGRGYDSRNDRTLVIFTQYIIEASRKSLGRTRLLGRRREPQLRGSRFGGTIEGLVRKCIPYANKPLGSGQRRHALFAAVSGDKSVTSIMRIAMHDHSPTGDVEHPVFDDAGPSIQGGFRGEV